MRLAVITAILAIMASIAAPTALADGDPASDVLVASSLFNPVDGVSPGAQAQLDNVLAASAKAGFPIRVALIAGPTDLGAVSTLWKHPHAYAVYLEDELSLQYGGQVLVVMPNGFGLSGPSHGPDRIGARESAVQALEPGAGERLATAALSAVPLLARAAGHPIAAAELAAAEHAASSTEAAATGGSLSVSAVIALVAGALLIALAWTLSLRARPLQLRRKPAA